MTTAMLKSLVRVRGLRRAAVGRTQGIFLNTQRNYYYYYYYFARAGPFAEPAIDLCRGSVVFQRRARSPLFPPHGSFSRAREPLRHARTARRTRRTRRTWPRRCHHCRYHVIAA